MTHILESWEDFVEYAGFCRYGAYQVLHYEQNRVEVRVLAGKFGFTGEFELNDPIEKENFERIMRYIRDHGYMKVACTVPEEQFFK